MTTVQQILQLQELDQEISRVRGVVASAEEQLGDHTQLDKLEADLSAARALVPELQRAQRQLELDAESMRQAVASSRQKLYGGTINNLRELEALEKETASLQMGLQRREEALLENMLTVEEGQSAVTALEEQHRVQQQAWQVHQEELTDEWQELGESLEKLEARRKELAVALPPPELSLYERLRASKAGQAVARVERGLCRGCLISLPTHELQRARISREPVQCSSCERILFVS